MTGIKEFELAIRRVKNDLDWSISSLDRSLVLAKVGGPARHFERTLLVQFEFRRFFEVMTEEDK